MSSLWRSAADSSWCTYRGNIHFRWCRLPCTWYIPSIFSSTLSTTSHSLKFRLRNLHYHGVPLYTPTVCVVSLASSVGVACSMPQYLKQEVFFTQLTLFFFMSRNKRDLTRYSDKTHIHNTQNTKLLHILCMSIIKCLLRHYSPTYYLLLCWFSTRKRTGFAGNVQSTMKWDMRSFGTLRSVEW